MCLYPILGTNPKYKATKKNGGIIPAVLDERVKHVPFKCGRCIECMKQKAREWQIRLLETIKKDNNGIFVTLTLNTQSIINLKDYEKTWTQSGSKAKVRMKIDQIKGYEQDNEIITVAVRLFLERWRKEFKTSIKHWLVTELGTKQNEHIHIHGIMWYDKNKTTKSEFRKNIDRKWQYGYIYPRNDEQLKTNYLNEKTVGYITKYINKIDEIHKEYQPRILTSSGIGKEYINTHNANRNKYKGEKTEEHYTTNTGHKMSMPIYWRNKIYTKEEREKLWIQKLNKEQRFICGEKISIKNGYKEYDEVLKHYREKNKKLGYGTDEKNWDREQYENQRREIIRETRIAKYKKQYKKENMVLT